MEGGGELRLLGAEFAAQKDGQAAARRYLEKAFELAQRLAHADQQQGMAEPLLGPAPGRIALDEKAAVAGEMAQQRGFGIGRARARLELQPQLAVRAVHHLELPRPRGYVRLTISVGAARPGSAAQGSTRVRLTES